MTNPILQARRLGQGIWQDELGRGMIGSGALESLVRRGLSGVTANPSIFEKAIGGSPDYDPEIRTLAAKGIRDPVDLYERLAVRDIREAADVLRPVYDETGGRDGFVSFEVSPALAHDERGTVEEARRFHRTIARDNLMIKVPGTPEGCRAVRTLTSEGIQVNVTLLFALEAYRDAAEAYWTGLEDRIARHRDPGRVAGVASFFLSRIDTAVDGLLQERIQASEDPEAQRRLRDLLGKAALANARLAYSILEDALASPRWKRLAEAGARPQRLLWASTSTKDPRYPELMYVEDLIGPDTVNTMPAETLREFLSRGRVRETLAKGLEEARRTLKALADAGISMRRVTDSLLEDGISRFSTSLEKLLQTLRSKAGAASPPDAGARKSRTRRLRREGRAASRRRISPLRRSTPRAARKGRRGRSRAR